METREEGGGKKYIVGKTIKTQLVFEKKGEEEKHEKKKLVQTIITINKCQKHLRILRPKQ